MLYHKNIAVHPRSGLITAINPHRQKKGSSDKDRFKGLGTSFAAANSASLFIQAKVDIDFTSKNYAPDSPVIVVPINLGLKFGV